MPRPNFLFIVTDQQRADHLGCYGNRVLKTPNIDAIAARGVRFDRYHVANPSCMPNRASMMTGRMPSSHGVWTNGVPLSDRATTMTHHLENAGYTTALIGKSHLQAFTGVDPVTQPDEPGPGLASPRERYRDATIGFREDGRYDQELYPKWESDTSYDVDRPYYGFEHVDLLVQHGDTTSGHYARWAEAKDPDFRRLCGPDNEAGGHDYTCPWAWRTALPEDLYPTRYVEDMTVDYLDAYAAGDRDAPFFIQCSFTDPHHPFVPPGKYFDMYKPEDVELPASFGAHTNPPEALSALWEDRDSGARDRWSHLPMAVTEKEAREAIALTYGMIAMIDDAVGAITDRLKQHGLDENTVIIFCSDHGDFLGDHQILLKGPLHYQGLVRTPFVWADPEGRSGASTDALASAIDLCPTVLTRAGIQPNYGVQGMSLLDVMKNGNGGHESVLIEEDPQRTFMGFDVPPRARTLIARDHRISIYETAEWGELYDLGNDPNELHNLWDDPGSEALRSTMLERLARKMTELSNRSPLPTHRG